MPASPIDYPKEIINNGASNPTHGGQIKGNHCGMIQDMKSSTQPWLPDYAAEQRPRAIRPAKTNIARATVDGSGTTTDSIPANQAAAIWSYIAAVG